MGMIADKVRERNLQEHAELNLVLVGAIIATKFDIRFQWCERGTRHELFTQGQLLRRSGKDI